MKRALPLLITGLVLGLSAFPASSFGQEPDASPAVAASAANERTNVWPDVDSTEALRTSLAKIRKATSDEMERQGQAEIVVMGAGAAPLLLKALGKERSTDARKRIVTALDAVTTATFTPALAELFGEKKVNVRNYVLQRVAELGDPQQRETADGLWSDLQKQLADKRKASKVDPGTVDATALLAFACGSPASAEHMIERAGSKGFSKISDSLNAAAANARASGEAPSRAVADALLESLTKDSPMKSRLGALRLLTFAGSEDDARKVAAQLDAAENQVKIAAINALRQMVDGDPPIKKLSAFDAIERAKKWKSRI